MKKLAIVALLIYSNVASASWNDPEAPFSTKENVSETMTIIWKAVDDVQSTCRSEYSRRGFGGFNYKVDACSFWNFSKKTCTIYTKKNPTLHDVGHEVRHCYQGNYH